MAIRQISNGHWQSRVRKKGHPTQSKVFKKKVDAEKWEHDVLAQMNRGVFVSAKEAERTTLRELLQRNIDEYVPRLADARRTTNRALALMKRPIAQMIVASVRSSDVAAFIKERQAD